MKPLILILGLLFLISCSTKKVLLKNNIVYTYSTTTSGDGTPIDQYTPYSVIKPKKVKITDNGDYLVINDDPASDKKHYSAGSSKPISPNEKATWKRELGKKAYFDEKTADKNRKSLWYRDNKIVLQTATIPLKIRSQINNSAYLDSFPSQVETGVSIGFLIGNKVTWNRYRTSANIFGQKTDKYSVTGGLLLSLGGTDLSTTTTRPKIQIPRKAPTLSYGGSIVLGVNSINIGWAFGWDSPMGKNASTWVYNGKMWNGVIISLDLIK